VFYSRFLGNCCDTSARPKSLPSTSFPIYLSLYYSGLYSPATDRVATPLPSQKKINFTMQHDSYLLLLECYFACEPDYPVLLRNLFVPPRLIMCYENNRVLQDSPAICPQVWNTPLITRWRSFLRHMYPDCTAIYGMREVTAPGVDISM
jgi:hypothetical protein